MTLWEVSLSSGTTVTPIEFVRCTAKFAINADGTRQALRTDWHCLLKSRTEAVRFKHSLLKGQYRSALFELKQKKDALLQFESTECLPLSEFEDNV